MRGPGNGPRTPPFSRRRARSGRVTARDTRGDRGQAVTAFRAPRPALPRRRGGWSDLTCGQAFPLTTGELEIVPGHALVLVAGVAQEKGGMERGHEHDIPVEIRPAAQLGDAVPGAEEGLGGKVAQGEDHRRLESVELCEQEGIAGGYLVGLRIAVSLRMALHDIADVAVAIAIELHRGEHLGQELPGPAHERLALLVLFLARSLADHHQLR